METDDTVQILFRTLLLTCHHSNRQLYRAGLQTMDVVMNEIAKCISIQGTNKSNVFRWLLVTLSGLIEDSSSPRNVIVGISGCGHLASSIASLAPQHLVPITRRLIKFASRLESKAKEDREKETADEQQESKWFVRAERMKEIIMNRARYLSTISSLVLELKEDPPSDITRAIVETVQSLIVEFPDLYKGYRDFICIAISRAFASLVDKSGSALTAMLDQTIDHALIRTVTSNDTTTSDGAREKEDTTLSEEQGTFYNETTGLVDHRLLFPYLPFWLSILTSHDKSLFRWGATEGAGSRVVKSVYGELLRCILKRLEQLDLRVQEQKTKEDAEEDQETIVKPMFPKDYTIFLNLVTFCEKLLSKRGVKEFESWLNPTIRCLIQMNRKFDGGVSGVYKLIELSIRISSSTIGKRQDVLDLLAPFVSTLLKRVTQLKDELLLSALRCLLASPSELVCRMGVSAFVPALKQAFRLGLRHNPIASVGLRTLERWSESQKNVDSVRLV